MERYLKKLEPLNNWLDRFTAKRIWPLTLAVLTVFTLALMYGADKMWRVGDG